MADFGQSIKPLIADFRLLNHLPGQKVWFACVPELLPAMERYGTVTETKKAGVYELDLHPLVDWVQLMNRLEEISGMKRSHYEI